MEPAERKGEYDHQQQDDKEYVHVYPQFGRAHVLVGKTCWCQPVPDEEVPTVLIHNIEQ